MRERRRKAKPAPTRPYGAVKNPFEPIEVLSADQVEDIHSASMAILETTGMRVLDMQTRELMQAAGAAVEGDAVRFDRALVNELLSTAPSSFTIQGRDPKKNLTIGEDQMIFASVGGPPFVSDLDKGRREGSYEDMRNFIKLVQSFDILHMEGGNPVEPSDLPVNSRHLDMYLSQCELMDKPWQPQMVGRERVRDALRMAEIAHGTDAEGLAVAPTFLAVTNTNTPLILDGPIAEGIIELAAAGQAVCVTPFALAGSMAPITLAGALALQNAEALVGVALTQIVRPGARPAMAVLQQMWICDLGRRFLGHRNTRRLRLSAAKWRADTICRGDPVVRVRLAQLMHKRPMRPRCRYGVR